MDPDFYIQIYLPVCFLVGTLVLANSSMFHVYPYLKEQLTLTKSFLQARNYSKHFGAFSSHYSFMDSAHFVGEDL